MPERIQLRRVKGYRKPSDAVIVDRRTKWGNPIRVVRGDPAPAVTAYRRLLHSGGLDITPAQVRRELRGKDLACWCPIGSPCHADVLLKVANR